jgi:hypothetical protein
MSATVVSTAKSSLLAAARIAVDRVRARRCTSTRGMSVLEWCSIVATVSSTASLTNLSDTTSPSRTDRDRDRRPIASFWIDTDARSPVSTISACAALGFEVERHRGSGFPACPSSARRSPRDLTLRWQEVESSMVCVRVGRGSSATRASRAGSCSTRRASPPTVRRSRRVNVMRGMVRGLSLRDRDDAERDRRVVAGGPTRW